MATLDDVVDDYRSMLADRGRLPQFERRFASAPESLRAEAVTFEFLVAQGLSPTLHEDLSGGGCDFECAVGSARFAVEVTSLKSETVAERSGVDAGVPSATTIELDGILGALRNRISSKGSNSQALTYSGPRVLAICSEHWLSSVMFIAAAPDLLTGKQGVAWTVSPTGPLGDSYLFTDFEKAAYLRAGDTSPVNVFRPKLSVVLLLAVHRDDCHVVALRNPEPEHVLPAAAFSNVPTVELQWPASNNQLRVRWTHNDRPLRHRFGSR